MKEIFVRLCAFFASFRSMPEPNKTVLETRPKRSLAWGHKISAEAREDIFSLAYWLSVDPNWIMACIAFETGETFNPAEKNRAGSGATGLIQFMPKTAIALGTSVQALALMTVVEQLVYVRKYFAPYRGRMLTLSDVYMAILWPAGIGKPEGWILWDQASKPTTYRQNAGLDGNKDGTITKAEAAAKVQAKLERGMRPENFWSES